MAARQQEHQLSQQIGFTENKPSENFTYMHKTKLLKAFLELLYYS